MARRSDLLTLLSKRSNDPTSSGPPRPAEKPKSPTPKRPGASERSLATTVKSWFGRAGKPGSGPPQGQPARPARPSPPVQIPVVGLAAIVVCALGLGFVLGRAFGGRPDPARGAQDRELRVLAGKQGLEAGWLVDDPSEVPQGQEMQAQVMAKWYLPVLIYEAHLKHDALRLAEYLQEHQIKTARILYFESIKAPGEAVGKPCWGTVVYVASKNQGARYLDELRKVPPPVFETSFSDSLGKLEGLVASGDAPYPSATR